MKISKHAQSILIEALRAYLERTERLNDTDSHVVDDVRFVLMAVPDNRDSEIVCEFFYSLSRKSAEVRSFNTPF